MGRLLRLNALVGASLVGVFFAVVSLGASGPAWAAPAPPSPTDQAALQGQATALAVAIRQQGVELDRLAEQVDQARLHSSQVAADIDATQANVVTTNGQVDATLRLVRIQAIEAYVGVDRRTVPVLSGIEGANALARRQAYADTVDATQTEALRRLRRLRQQLAAAQDHLTVERQLAQAALDQVTADQQAAARQVAAQQATLSQVQGELTAMVQAEQARLAADEAAKVQARLGLQVALARQTPAPPSSSSLPTLGSRPGGGALTPPVVPPRRPTQPPPPAPPSSFPTTGRPPSPPLTLPPSSPPRPSGPNTPARGAQTAIAAAEAQLGKPYQWGGAGPDTFDCSGLVSWAWAAAGVYFPHLAQAQYNLTRRIAIADLLPGDLVFYGTPSSVYHVGIYIGSGRMIDAPTTGQVVHYAGIFFSGLLGGGRVASG
jgi:cell wall-associated NlpC family hydrolase